jgi:hypothetical protein
MRYEVKSLSTAKNRIAVLSAATAASIFGAGHAYAVPIPNGPVVSLQFSDGFGQISNSSWQAGVVSEPKWNYTTDITQAEAAPGPNHTSTLTSNGGSPNALSLLDSTGAASGITYSYSYGRANQSIQPPFPQPPAVTTYDYNLADRTAGISGSDGNPNANTLMISGLNANDTYDIIAYVNGFFFDGSGASEEVTLGSTNYYLQTSSTATAWTQSQATSAGTAAPSNYVEFDALSGVTSETLTVDNTGTAYGLDGIQIVPVAAVPEPASLGVLGVVGTGLLLRRRRGLIRN